MPKLINFLAPFTSMKIAIINALLAFCPQSTKVIIIDRVIAKQLSDFHLKMRPYKRNPRVTGVN